MTDDATDIPSSALIEGMALRRTCGSFGTGVTVITTRNAGIDHGMTANAFMSVSLDPPLILVSVDRRAKMQDKITNAGRYAVSVLSAEMVDIAMHFAGKPRDWLDTPFVDFGGLPVVRGALAQIVAKLAQVIPAGDHVLYLGAVEHLNRDEGHPLIFHDGRFCKVPEPMPAAVGFDAWGIGAARIASRYVDHMPELW